MAAARGPVTRAQHDPRLRASIASSAEAAEGSSAGISVRPARLDRPLRGSAIDAVYTDAHLEELVRVAADGARERARAEGYAAGWAQGRQAAGTQAQAELEAGTQRLAAERAQLRRRVELLLGELAEATRAAHAQVAPEWVEVADVLAAGAIQLAAAAIERELTSVDGALVLAVTGALRHLADPGDAVVHLNPADAALLADDENAAIGVRVIADPAIAPGSLIALTPAQRLRHDLPAALAAAQEVLRS